MIFVYFYVLFFLLNIARAGGLDLVGAGLGRLSGSNHITSLYLIVFTVLCVFKHFLFFNVLPSPSDLPVVLSRFRLNWMTIGSSQLSFKKKKNYIEISLAASGLVCAHGTLVGNP